MTIGLRCWFFMHKVENFVKFTTRLVCVILPIWFFMENFLPLFFSMIVEIQKSKNVGSAYIIQMSVGIFLNLCYFILSVLILSYFVIWFFKMTKRNLVFFLKQDLNEKYRVCSFLYYFDYFIFRSLILLLFGLNTYVKSIILWYALLILFMISFLTNQLWVYKAVSDQILFSFNYILVLLVILYFIILHYLHDESDQAKLKRNTIFSIVFIIYTVFVFLLCLTKTVISFLLWLKEKLT